MKRAGRTWVSLAVVVLAFGAAACGLSVAGAELVSFEDSGADDSPADGPLPSYDANGEPGANSTPGADAAEASALAMSEGGLSDALAPHDALASKEEDIDARAEAAAEGGGHDAGVQPPLDGANDAPPAADTGETEAAEAASAEAGALDEPENGGPVDGSAADDVIDLGSAVSCYYSGDCPPDESCDTSTSTSTGLGVCTTACNQSQPCNMGCCDNPIAGHCQPGTTTSACGPARGICQVCARSQVCSAMAYCD